MSKYPRTLHLPQSPGGTRDDRRHSDLTTFVGRALIFTEKLDGSNVCLERNGCYARSHNHAPSHPSFDAFKALHARVRHRIPPRLQVFGEWLYAKHSIQYTRLQAYLQIFAVRDSATEAWLSWDDVQNWSEDLQVPTVPLIAIVVPGTEAALERYIQELGADEAPSRAGGEGREGFVVRWAEGFSGLLFENAVGKWVRKNHVQSDEHWTQQQIVKNLLQGAPDQN